MSLKFGNTAIALAALVALTVSGAAVARLDSVTLERAPSGHFLVPVTINGQGPYTFLFDTGASHTAIAQPVAETLGFRSEWNRTDDVQSLTTRFEAERFALNRFEFATTGPMLIDSVVIPDSADNPNPIDGLLGADAINARRYAMDFSAGTLTFHAAPAQIADGRVSPIGLLLSRAHLQRGVSHINVIIDSGSALSIVNQRLAHYIRHRSGTVRYNINGVDDDVDIEAAPVNVRRFQIGGLCIDRFPALQADLDVFSAQGWDHEPAMILGMDVLQYATISIDRDSGIVQIDASDPSHSCAR
jgi:predicted aspartyl protease